MNDSVSRNISVFGVCVHGMSNGCSVLSGTMLRLPICTNPSHHSGVHGQLSFANRRGSRSAEKRSTFFGKNIFRCFVVLCRFASAFSMENPRRLTYFRFVGTTVLVSGIEWTGERCDLRWNGSQREKEFTGRVAEPHKFAWKLRKYRCL